MKRRTYLSALGVGFASPGWHLSSHSPTSETVSDDSASGEGPAECPEFADGIETVCCQDVEHTEQSVYLEPSETTYQPLGAGSVDPIILTLYNNVDGVVTFNPYSWTVYEYTGGQWERVAPAGLRPQPAYLLQPGRRFTWGLSSFEERIPVADHPISFQPSSGTYAFTISVSAPSSVENEEESAEESAEPDGPNTVQSRETDASAVEEDESEDETEAVVGLELVAVFDVTCQTTAGE